MADGVCFPPGYGAFSVKLQGLAELFAVTFARKLLTEILLLVANGKPNQTGFCEAKNKKTSFEKLYQSKYWDSGERQYSE